MHLTHSMAGVALLYWNRGGVERLVYHMTGFAILFLAFLVGRLMVIEARKWSDALASRMTSRGRLRDVLVYSGRVLQVIAAVWGFLEAVAVTILAT